MVPTISCLSINFNRDAANFTFTQFKNYVKVILNGRSIVLTNDQLVENCELFQMFVMSLLFTEDITKIDKVTINDKVYYGVSTMVYCRNFATNRSYKFIHLEKTAHRNPLNCKEPKRSTSSKKYNKFFRYFYNCLNDKSYIIDPKYMIRDYFLGETSNEMLIDYREE